MSKLNQEGGTPGGLGTLKGTSGTFNLGTELLGGIRGGWGILTWGWVGTLPGLLMLVALPTFSSPWPIFLNVCEGGASAVSEMMF